MPSDMLPTFRSEMVPKRLGFRKIWFIGCMHGWTLMQCFLVIVSPFARFWFSLCKRVNRNRGNEAQRLSQYPAASNLFLRELPFPEVLGLQFFVQNPCQARSGFKSKRKALMFVNAIFAL